MNFLFIDTSTDRGIIGYGNQCAVQFFKELPFGTTQSRFLIPYLSEQLRNFSGIEAIGVGVGPGSYTGIRLGVSVAQALAYAWKLPLVGISSLEGFIPSEQKGEYAAILDARIGGVYLQIGNYGDDTAAKTIPRAVPLAEAIYDLENIPLLVTPQAKSLKDKFKEHFPNHQWKWEERSPSIEECLTIVEKNYKEGKKVFPPEKLSLLYLRKTEAESSKA